MYWVFYFVFVHYTPQQGQQLNCCTVPYVSLTCCRRSRWIRIIASAETTFRFPKLYQPTRSKPATTVPFPNASRRRLPIRQRVPYIPFGEQMRYFTPKLRATIDQIRRLGGSPATFQTCNSPYWYDIRLSGNSCEQFHLINTYLGVIIGQFTCYIMVLIRHKKALEHNCFYITTDAWCCIMRVLAWVFSCLVFWIYWFFMQIVLLNWFLWPNCVWA